MYHTIGILICTVYVRIYSAYFVKDETLREMIVGGALPDLEWFGCARKAGIRTYMMGSTNSMTSILSCILFCGSCMCVAIPSNPSHIYIYVLWHLFYTCMLVAHILQTRIANVFSSRQSVYGVGQKVKFGIGLRDVCTVTMCISKHCLCTQKKRNILFFQTIFSKILFQTLRSHFILFLSQL